MIQKELEIVNKLGYTRSQWVPVMCNMLTCGSQTKAKAWYHRKKEGTNKKTEK